MAELAYAQRRAKLADSVNALSPMPTADAVKQAAQEWLAGKDDAKASKDAGKKLLANIAAGTQTDVAKAVTADADLLTKKLWPDHRRRRLGV